MKEIKDNYITLKITNLIDIINGLDSRSDFLRKEIGSRTGSMYYRKYIDEIIILAEKIIDLHTAILKLGLHDEDIELTLGYKAENNEE